MYPTPSKLRSRIVLTAVLKYVPIAKDIEVPTNLHFNILRDCNYMGNFLKTIIEHQLAFSIIFFDFGPGWFFYAKLLRP